MDAEQKNILLKFLGGDDCHWISTTATHLQHSKGSVRGMRSTNFSFSQQTLPEPRSADCRIHFLGSSLPEPRIVG